MERKAGRAKTEKKNGQKWVEGNFDAKAKARAENGGVLPYSPALETTDHPLSRDWSHVNLPEVLFYLSPPPSQYHGEKVLHLRNDVTGEKVLSEEGNPIRDFPILPRYISVEVEGWMIEAWRRIDSRITYQDIVDRQRSDPDFAGIGLKKLSKNALQNHCYRDCRKVLNSWVEYGRRGEPHRTEVETMEGLTNDQITRNTVLEVSREFPNRVVRVTFQQRTSGGLYYTKPVEVTAANVRQTTFDIMYFAQAALPSISPTNPLTASMEAAWEMSLVLSERAQKHGKKHWSKLDKQCLPATWSDRVQKSKQAVPNSTYDGGCAICTWTTGYDDAFTSDAALTVQGSSTKRKRDVTDFCDDDESPMQKRMRADIPRAERDEFDSDDELCDPAGYETDVSISPTRNWNFETPSKPGGTTPKVFAGDEEFDTDIVVKDTKGSALPSQIPLGLEGWYSNHLHRYFGGVLTPSAQLSNSAGYNDDTQHLSDFPNHQQLQWERSGSYDNAIGVFDGSPTPNIGQSIELGHYQGQEDRIYHSGSSHNSSPLSSGHMDLTSPPTSPDSSDEANNVQDAIYLAHAKMQGILAIEPTLDLFPSQSSLQNTGWISAQGNGLPDMFATPPPKRISNIECTTDTHSPSTYAPADCEFGSSPPTYNTPGSYAGMGLPSTPSYDGIQPNIQWSIGSLEYVGDYPAQQAGVQHKEHFSQLPQVPSTSGQPTPHHDNFMNLLSSDPIMPDVDFEQFINADMY